MGRGLRIAVIGKCVVFIAHQCFDAVGLAAGRASGL